MQALIDSIKSYFDAFVQYWTDFALSIKDFITDLPSNLVLWVTNIFSTFLDWASTTCSYCLGGSLPGSISTFAFSLQNFVYSLQPCVLYALSQVDIMGCLQILLCAYVIFTTLYFLRFMLSMF